MGDRIHERLLRAIELDVGRIPWGSGLQQTILIPEKVEGAHGIGEDIRHADDDDGEAPEDPATMLLEEDRVPRHDALAAVL